MQSFTTQSHQRNYQGNVIFPTRPQKTDTRRHQVAGIITTILLMFTFVVMCSLLGIMTVHNQRLTQKIQTLETQNTAIQARPSENHPTENQPEAVTQKSNVQPQRGKTLRRIPISQRQQDTEPMPSIN